MSKSVNYYCGRCKKIYSKKNYYVKGKICKNCLIKESKNSLRKSHKLIKDLNEYYLYLKKTK